MHHGNDLETNENRNISLTKRKRSVRVANKTPNGKDHFILKKPRIVTKNAIQSPTHCSEIGLKWTRSCATNTVETTLTNVSQPGTTAATKEINRKIEEMNHDVDKNNANTLLSTDSRGIEPTGISLQNNLKSVININFSNTLLSNPDVSCERNRIAMAINESMVCHDPSSTENERETSSVSLHTKGNSVDISSTLLNDNCRKRSIPPEAVTYRCDICDYTTNRKYSMQRHSDVHYDKRRFVCETCGKSFQSLLTLKDHHIFIHSDQRNFHCDLCSLTFKNKSSLVRHTRKHSDVRPWACHCSAKFKRACHLQRHLRIVHNEFWKSRKLEKIIVCDSNIKPSQTYSDESCRTKAIIEQNPARSHLEISADVINLAGNVNGSSQFLITDPVPNEFNGVCDITADVVVNNNSMTSFCDISLTDTVNRSFEN